MKSLHCRFARNIDRPQPDLEGFKFTAPDPDSRGMVVRTLGLLVVLVALVDVIRWPRSIWKGTDEAFRATWVLALCLVPFAAIWWWCSYTRRALTAERRRRKRFAPPEGPGASEEQVGALGDLLLGKGFEPAEASGVAYVLSRRFNGGSLIDLTAEIGSLPTVEECRSFTRVRCER
jgi:hypothetical protein